MTDHWCRNLGACLVLGAGLAAAGAAAEPQPYTVDRSHSAVLFEISHLGFSNTYGRFREFDADIRLDLDDLASSSVVLRIQAASIDTDWPKRDEHIRSSDFLDVGNHPEIVFRSTSIEVEGPDTARLLGQITIRGETREEEFEVKLIKKGKGRDGRDVVGFEARGVIDRTRYGVDYAAPAIGAEMGVTVALEISPN